jgi:hypothetical protein
MRRGGQFRFRCVLHIVKIYLYDSDLRFLYKKPLYILSITLPKYEIRRFNNGGAAAT